MKFLPYKCKYVFTQIIQCISKLLKNDAECKYKESLFFLIKFGFQIFNLFASGHVVREVAELFVVVEDELEAADLKQQFDKLHKNAKKE